MKKIIITAGISFALIAAVYVFAADHVDAPAVGSLSTGSTVSDITDFYAFESPENSENYVFVCNVNALLAPGSASQDASFDENIMYEFNIDTDADNVEDLVIQAIFRDDQVISYGPIAQLKTGLESTLALAGTRVQTKVTAYGETSSVGENSGVKLFAGPRDDPFFMDFFQFVGIVNGVGGAPTPPTSFNTPGTDAFEGTNILSVVIEVPKNMIGGSGVSKFSTWVKAKQAK